jgi:hypothetical protein
MEPRSTTFKNGFDHAGSHLPYQTFNNTYRITYDVYSPCIDLAGCPYVNAPWIEWLQQSLQNTEIAIITPKINCTELIRENYGIVVFLANISPTKRFNLSQLLLVKYGYKSHQWRKFQILNDYI